MTRTHKLSLTLWSKTGKPVKVKAAEANPMDLVALLRKLADQFERGLALEAQAEAALRGEVVEP